MKALHEELGAKSINGIDLINRIRQLMEENAELKETVEQNKATLDMTWEIMDAKNRHIDALCEDIDNLLDR